MSTLLNDFKSRGIFSYIPNIHTNITAKIMQSQIQPIAALRSIDLGVVTPVVNQ